MLVDRESELERLRIALQTSRLVAIVGPPGMGKSTLARHYVEVHGAEFPGGIQFIESHHSGSRLEAGGTELLLGPAAPTAASRSLVVIDGVDELSSPVTAGLLDQVRRLPGDARVLVTSREPFPNADLQLDLGRFSEGAASQLLAGYGVTALDASSLMGLIQGHPLSTASVGSLIAGGHFTPQELLLHLQNFHASGIVSPEGRPLRIEGEPTATLRVEVAEITDDLLRAIDKDIGVARELSPRQFEQLVAELMARRGYTVEMTPASKDGGKDIYVARRDDLGAFLYLVECKRYAAENPVGVEIVRALHGTVQAERATAGILVTTSVFTKGARAFQRQVPYQLSLRDYVELHRWVRVALRGTA